MLIAFYYGQNTFSQAPKKRNSNQIYEEIQSLNFFGTVLYIAAHPDDENTRLLSYISHKEKARAVYLALTRGGGGQNLIGPEIRETLGVMRTQELLAARSFDGAEQRFARAVDFGYSKVPSETFKIWDRKAVLSDVVWAIRTLKPDIVINRFDHRTPGTTHGHHSASAMLSVEAFDLAAQKASFPEQLKYTDVWQPQRLFFNTSWWFYGSKDRFNKAGKSHMLSFDIGTYYPLKGLSNNEIAALASSQHRCQGFGRLSQRGSQKEYIELLKGEMPKDGQELFSGIETSWRRVKGGAAIAAILEPIQENFNFNNPSVHLAQLTKAYALIEALEDTHWKTLKKEAITDIILACAGLYLEATSKEASTSPNEVVALKIEAINRSEVPVILKSLTFHPSGEYREIGLNLEANKRENLQATIPLQNEAYTTPYWLKTPASLGMYSVENPIHIGLPTTPKNIKVSFVLNMFGTDIEVAKDVVYRFSKRDQGELYQPFEVLPVVTTKIEENVVLFPNDRPKTIHVAVQSGKENVAGSLSLESKEGWQVSPKSIPFELVEKGELQSFSFKVTPPRNQSESELNAVVSHEGATFSQELIEIQYPHIPKQSMLYPSTAKVARMEIAKRGTQIGYIQGAGDVIPKCLEQIGYFVTELQPRELNAERLNAFDAVVVGIRAYNTLEDLHFHQKELLDYVKNGGNLIVQYNTAGRKGIDVKAPFELKVSRDRVTDEQAEVRFLAPEHPLLNSPNKISSKDFEGWVQERGLYFPNSWSKEYTPLLSINDAGETPKNGSLLVAPYGKGNYIYTGLSFFRELPAGVPGAYKLFANLLSLENR